MHVDVIDAQPLASKNFTREIVFLVVVTWIVWVQ
jgi:hypothetical protein